MITPATLLAEVKSWCDRNAGQRIHVTGDQFKSAGIRHSQVSKWARESELASEAGDLDGRAGHWVWKEVPQ